MVDAFTVSDLHDDREDEWPPARAFAEESAQFDAQLLLDDPLIGTFFDAGLVDYLAEQSRALGEQILAVLHDEAARDDVGNAFEHSGLFVDRHHRHHQSVFGEVASIAQYLVANLAGAGAVDQNAAGRRLARHSRAFGVDRHDVAVLDEQYLGLRIAPCEDPARYARMVGELAVFTVSRDEIARLDQRENQLQLLLAAVPGHVHVFRAFVNDVRAAPREVIHHAPDRLFVAGDRARRNHDRVF